MPIKMDYRYFTKVIEDVKKMSPCFNNDETLLALRKLQQIKPDIIKASKAKEIRIDEAAKLFKLVEQAKDYTLKNRIVPM